jgi:DNA polymerase-1
MKNKQEAQNQRVNNRCDILLIDGNNMMHRAYYKFGGLSSNSAGSSSMVFGVPYILKSLITKFKPIRVIAIFDGSRNKGRLKALPSYKEREKKEDFDYEVFDSQRNDLLILLEALGVGVVRINGQEADDIIYMFARKFKDKRVTIVSADKDFHQLITPNLRVYSTGKDILLDEDNLVDHFNYNPKQVVDYLILDGDKSDKIPGLKGMGEKRIKDFINQYGSIKAYLNSNTPGKVNRDTLKPIYKLNRYLIDLAYFYRKENRGLKLNYGVRGKFNEPTITKVCRKYNIRVILQPDFLKTFSQLS